MSGAIRVINREIHQRLLNRRRAASFVVLRRSPRALKFRFFSSVAALR
jgi:hypothetical protein